MKILIVPDKFKGSLTSAEVSAAIDAGIKRVIPEAETQIIAASDGGDGFLESVGKYTNAEKIEELTTDALGNGVFPGYFLIDRQNQTAYIEMAVSSGMQGIPEEERNPLRTTTYGTGILSASALDHDVRRIYVGLGGSATNDGGIGFAAALGYSFLDENGEAVPLTGEGLASIVRIEKSEETNRLDGIEFYAVNDVQNPLFGPEGAAHVYAPQKGASPEDVSVLDAGLRHLHEVARRELGKDEAETPGAGAAGGLGYGLRVFCNAEFVSGVNFVLGLTGIDRILSNGEFDCILTGEGKIDDQTAYGKLVHGVAASGKRHGVPVFAICGVERLDRFSLADIGLTDARQIHVEGQDLSYTIENAADLVEKAAASLCSGLA